MNRLLKHPATNAICLSIFTIFYASLFIGYSKMAGHFSHILYYDKLEIPILFMTAWSRFLATGNLAYLAYFLLGLTGIVIALLCVRKSPYDEYQMSILRNCLAVALAVTLIAIAIFYLLVLINPNGVIEKFTLFISIHWVTVIFADLVYCILCRWR